MGDNAKMKMAVIGLGIMGSSHVYELSQMENVRLVAVCDIDTQRADNAAEEYQAKAYYDYHELLNQQKDLDAVIIATPHYFHTPISIDFLKNGIHVLTEKPLAVHVKDGQSMIDSYSAALKDYPNLVFAIMFQQRTLGFWRKIKEMIDQDELGRLVRATWIITDWFRTQAYYDNGGWRATWKGEGGGVLLNQCPHNLDLYQWFFGLPKRVSGFVHLGKYHHIEVEDEASAYFEHENGMVGHFITTTAESPGTNRLEIVGEKGKLVFEGGRLIFHRNASSMFEFIQTCPGGFDTVDNVEEEINFPENEEPGHARVIEAFTRAITQGGKLVAPAVEGIRSLSIGNAIMLSSFLQRPIELPLDAELYAQKLNELVANSKFQKEVRSGSLGDINKSFSFYK